MPPEGEAIEDRPLATVAKVKNAYRLAAVDARATALGLKPGVALADARAMHPGLLIHEADPQAEAVTHASLVDWCRLFTPLAAPDGMDAAMLDITGAAHLFGGEQALLDTIVARQAKQGFVAHAAIAATSGAAWALARHGGARRLIPEETSDAMRAKIFAPMPLAALRLEAGMIARLGQAGLRRIGDLMLRPRAPISARFGPDIHHRLDVLLGQAKDPINPRFEAPPFIAERRFAEGIARREDVEATILSLAHDLCGLLARHGEGARQLDVALYRVDGAVQHIRAGTSRPLRDPIMMARLFRERIEAAGEDGLETGYGFDMVRLAALAAERLDQAQPGWDDTSGESDLADLIDRLGARFGLSRVTRLVAADTHRPERASVAVAAAVKAKPARTVAARAAKVEMATNEEASEALPDRPIRLLERPEPIDAVATVPDGPPLHFRWRRVSHQIAAIEGPERIGPDWWRNMSRQDPPRTRDYFRAEDTDGQRFWLYREGLYGEAATPRWFVHGLFA